MSTYVLREAPREVVGKADEGPLSPGKPLEKRHHGQLKCQREVKSAAWRPDSAMLVTGGYDKKLAFWAMATADYKAVLTIDVEEYIECVDWSPDGRLVACGCYDKTARLFEPESGEELEELEHGGIVYACKFSPTADVLACGCFEKKISLWHSRKGHLITTINVEGVVKALSWHPTGAKIASGGFDCAVSVWKTEASGARFEGGNLLLWRRSLGEDADDCRGLDFSRDANLLAAADWAENLSVFDAVSGDLLYALKQPDQLMTVAFSPESDVVLTGGWKCRARLFNVATREQVDDLYIGAEHEDALLLPIERPLFACDEGGQWVRYAIFSPNGETIAICSDDKTVHLWPRHAKTRSLHN